MNLSKLKNVILAIRPATLLTGAAPVILGSSVGYTTAGDSSEQPQALIFLVSVLAVVIMQAAANLVNDAKDAENGIDSDARKGPVRAVQSGLLSLQDVKVAYKTCFIISICLALVITYFGGVSVLVAALISAVFAYAYTGGPFPLAYYALKSS